MTRRAAPEPAGGRPAVHERAGAELLQTIAAVVGILGFLMSLANVPAILGALRPSGPSVLHVLNESSKPAVLLVSFPIFELLNVLLVISIARMTLSVLRRCSVALDSDLSTWSVLLLVLLPVALGTNLLSMIVLFGDAKIRPHWPVVGADPVRQFIVISEHFFIKFDDAMNARVLGQEVGREQQMVIGIIGVNLCRHVGIRRVDQRWN